MRWERGDFNSMVFKSPTRPELATEGALTELGIEFTSQYSPPGTRRIYDAFVEPNVLIEVHGDYWHNREPALTIDKIKEEFAVRHDYRLVVFWEHAVMKNPAVVELVKERLQCVLD